MKKKGGFVFTSNVDGHFQKSGFSEQSVFECHGSIYFLQLMNTSDGSEIWPVPRILRSESECGPPHSPLKFLARRNVVMFGDGSFVRSRAEEKKDRYEDWLQEIGPEDKIVD